ncbi:MAG TPA: DUF4388 domain-containing protein, partial [Myxococcales bacterium]|nr:DUF4388 domain-containing protein [Myxococcales bacterium]
LVLQRREKEQLEHKGPMAQFMGNLTDMGLVDLTQTLDAGRKSGTLRIRLPGREVEASVWFREGKVIDAELGRWSGEAAFYRMLALNEGPFTIDFGQVDRKDRIALSSQGLLLEGMRRVDERGRLLEQIPPLAAVYELDYAALVHKLPKIPDQVDGLLKLFDGKRSLGEVVDDAPFDELASLNLVAKLYFEGLLREAGSGQEAVVPPGNEVERWAADRSAAEAAVAPSPVLARGNADLPEHAAWFAAPEESAVTVQLAAPIEAPALDPSAPAAAVEPAVPPPLALAPVSEPPPMVETAPAAIAAPPPALSLQSASEQPFPLEVRDRDAASPGASRPVTIVHFPSERRSARGSHNGVPAAELSYFDQPQEEEPTPTEALDEPLRRRSRFGTAALALGVILVVAGGAYFALSPPAAPLAHTPAPKPPVATIPVEPAPSPATPPAPPKPAPTLPPTAVAARTAVPPVAAPPKPVEPPPNPHPPAPAATPVPSPEEIYRTAFAAGEAHYRRGAIRSAIVEYRKAVAARPDSDVALAALGNALYESGQTAAAERPLKRALELNPSNTRACLTLGTLYQTAGDRGQAATMYRKYLEIDPRGEFARDVRTILKTLH